MLDLFKSGYLCHPQQMYTLRSVTLDQGKARGTRVIEVCTAGGLQIDLLPDTGLDIGQVRYKGVNMTYISRNGYDSPTSIVPYENEFFTTFPGGLLYTCGLRTTGDAHRDGNEWQPFHGRYHGLMAENVCAKEKDGVIIVEGILRETSVADHFLEVKRTITIPVAGTQITVSDEITNLTHHDQELAVLYHCNYGYPLLTEKARLELPQQRKTTPRTAFAATLMGKETTFDAPAPGEEERVFFHEEMEHRAAIVNEQLGVRAELTWSESLPILSHWRSMAAGDYVCGLEPTNNYIMGAKQERENGTLPVLKPFETFKAQVHFSFFSI